MVERNKILLVEDSDEDFEVARRAFVRTGFDYDIIRCCDGDQAIKFLKKHTGADSQKTSTLPNLILLDLNLPGSDGVEVLETIKSDVNIRHIPVVMMTTSTDERDINRCYSLGANGYIQKPVDLKRFMLMIDCLSHYWFDVVVLPGKNKV